MQNTEVAARRADAISRGVGVTTQVYAQKAENAEIWDIEGRRYIDFAAGIAVVNTGHRHPRVIGSMEKAKAVVTDLFEAFAADPGLLPPDWAAACGAPGDDATGRVVRDYIAGMTDRFALAEYARIFRTEIDL